MLRTYISGFKTFSQVALQITEATQEKSHSQTNQSSHRSLNAERDKGACHGNLFDLWKNQEHRNAT